MAATFLVEIIREVVQAMLAQHVCVVIKVAEALDELETVTGEQVIAAFAEYLRMTIGTRRWRRRVGIVPASGRL